MNHTKGILEHVIKTVELVHSGEKSTVLLATVIEQLRDAIKTSELENYDNFKAYLNSVNKSHNDCNSNVVH